MAGLQRSAQTFRRSGSSGLVWDERFLTEGAGNVGGGGGARGDVVRASSAGAAALAERRQLLRRGEAAEHGDKKRTKVVALAKPKRDKDQQKQEEEVVVVPGRKAFRTRDVAPAAEPPSPRLPGCWGAPCAIFRGSGNGAGSASPAARRGANKPRKR